MQNLYSKCNHYIPFTTATICCVYLCSLCWVIFVEQDLTLEQVFTLNTIKSAQWTILSVQYTIHIHNGRSSQWRFHWETQHKRQRVSKLNSWSVCISSVTWKTTNPLESLQSTRLAFCVCVCVYVCVCARACLCVCVFVCVYKWQWVIH